MTDVILETRNLKKSFGKLEVLKGISTEIRRGEVVSIIGPSGGGKSTFLRCLNLLETPDSGQVLFKGQDITDKKLNISQYRQSIGMVFQHFNVFPNLTVLENVELPLIYQGIDPIDRRELAIQALTRVGLADRAQHKPTQMSGGQQQRVAIARAISTHPPIIMADEPTGALDSHTGREVLGMLQQMHDEGHTVVLITHDNSIAVQADRIIRLEDGRVVYDGDAHAPEAVVQPTLLPDEEEKA